MFEETSKKDYFEKMAMKAMKNRDKYDYFGITEKGTKAFLCASEGGRIRNAFVIINQAGKVEEWEVNDYEVTKRPRSLHVCIKNLNVLSGCMDDPENEESYFIFRKIKGAPIQELDIFGAVETEECAVIFYYDCEAKQSYYVAQSTYGKESADIFQLVKKLRYVEGRLHENGETNKKRLESTELDSTESWKVSLW